MRRLVLFAAPVLAVACGELRNGERANAAPPDSLPVLKLDSLPFRYPPALYVQLVQDNVTLRLFVDEFGRPVPESTRIEEHAKHPAFDTSALVGSRDLLFRPAYRNGQPIPYSVLFPIKFRVPNGPPLAGDSAPPGSSPEK
jgi:hypothetical protein